jgi:hypothetical protein
VFVGEISGKKMCVEGCGRREVLEILIDTWHATLASVSTSLLDV